MTIKIALLQSRSFPSKEESMAEHERLIAEAARNGANIICTQELCFTPYFCRTEDPDNFDLAETIPGPTTERFSALAAKYGVVLILPRAGHLSQHGGDSGCGRAVSREIPENAYSPGSRI